MVGRNSRAWSDAWAARLGRDPEKFAQEVASVDIDKAPPQEIAKALDVSEMKASYIKRGWHRFGTTYPTLTRMAPLPAITRIYSEYQKLIDEEVKLENRLIEIRKDLEKYSPIAHAFRSLQEATKKLVN